MESLTNLEQTIEAATNETRSTSKKLKPKQVAKLSLEVRLKAEGITEEDYRTKLLEELSSQSVWESLDIETLETFCNRLKKAFNKKSE
jgi:signal transduction histidine kinase